MEELALALNDADPGIRSQAVLDLGGILPMYELVQDEEAEPFIRQAAAQALVTLGLLRRQRVGPSRSFLWLVGMALVIVAAAAAGIIGVLGAIVLFAAGSAALVLYYRRVARKERASRTYIGPDGATIQL
jgi:Flp pilus assembly protein TadB